MVYTETSASYDAFLSYSWKSDKAVALAIQIAIHRSLCPWYKLRSKNVFRDLSCLPAGSSLYAELFGRLDRSNHLIILASPDAAISNGMEIEAKHWFERPRDGQVLVVVTDGHCQTSDNIRTYLPKSARLNLKEDPLSGSQLYIGERRFCAIHIRSRSAKNLQKISSKFSYASIQGSIGANCVEKSGRGDAGPLAF